MDSPRKISLDGEETPSFFFGGGDGFSFWAFWWRLVALELLSNMRYVKHRYCLCNKKQLPSRYVFANDGYVFFPAMSLPSYHTWITKESVLNILFKWYTCCSCYYPILKYEKTVDFISQKMQEKYRKLSSIIVFNW